MSFASLHFISFRFVSRHGAAHAGQRHKEKDQLHAQELRLRVPGSGHMHGGIAPLAVVTAHYALMVRRRGKAGESLAPSLHESVSQRQH